MDNLLNDNLCRHLHILRDKPEFWDSFTSSDNNEGRLNINIDAIEQDNVVRQEADDENEIQEDEVQITV